MKLMVTLIFHFIVIENDEDNDHSYKLRELEKKFKFNRDLIDINIQIVKMMNSDDLKNHIPRLPNGMSTTEANNEIKLINDRILSLKSHINKLNDFMQSEDDEAVSIESKNIDNANGPQMNLAKVRSDPTKSILKKSDSTTRDKTRKTVDFRSRDEGSHHNKISHNDTSPSQDRAANNENIRFSKTYKSKTMPIDKSGDECPDENTQTFGFDDKSSNAVPNRPSTRANSLRVFQKINKFEDEPEDDSMEEDLEEDASDYGNDSELEKDKITKSAPKHLPKTEEISDEDLEEFEGGKSSKNLKSNKVKPLLHRYKYSFRDNQEPDDQEEFDNFAQEYSTHDFIQDLKEIFDLEVLGVSADTKLEFFDTKIHKKIHIYEMLMLLAQGVCTPSLIAILAGN